MNDFQRLWLSFKRFFRKEKVEEFVYTETNIKNKQLTFYENSTGMISYNTEIELTQRERKILEDRLKERLKTSRHGEVCI